MTEVLLFVLGFSSVLSVYETVQTKKHTKADKLMRQAKQATKGK
jgi:hypothetical protein